MIRPFLFLIIPSLFTALFAFSTTNLQYLYGQFDDNTLYDTSNGGKSTVTLEHYRTFEYGDIFGFADYAVADDRFLWNAKNKTDLYFELSPRISIDKVTGQDLSIGIVKQWYAAFQYNRSIASNYEDFDAYLYGIGSDLDLPGFLVFGLNGYKKNQKFSDNTYQLSINYETKKMFETELFMTGFIDWTEDDYLMQNQLLYDFGPSRALVDGRFQAGTEWHYYHVKSTNLRSSCWQVLLKVVW